MPTTAKIHFDEDISRAYDLLNQAHTMQTTGSTAQLTEDIRGSAVALAVGAMDAYFCDKYVDCIAAALQAYSTNSWPGTFPSAFRKIQLPAGEVLDALRKQRPKWGIRMAARSVMEKDNMYSLARLEDAFNGILPQSHKLWEGIIPQLTGLKKKRFTTYVTSDLATLTGSRLGTARKKVAATVKNRIGETVVFRHNWIHNCARPKVVIQNLSHGKARVAMNEIESLVNIFDAHIENHRIV